MSIPLLVVTIKPGEFLADYQGAYAAGATYQKGQIVKAAPESFYSCLAVSKGNTPEEGSPFWGFLGNLEAVVTTAAVEEAQEDAEEAAKAFAVGGAWTALEGLGAGAEEKPGPAPTLGVRTESAGTAARLRGGVLMAAGKTIVKEVQLVKLPVGFRPTATEVFAATDATGVLRQVTITAAGVLTLGTDLKPGETVNLDGITFPTS
jgi:hypothetical protein